jgi:hypothetical protein
MKYLSYGQWPQDNEHDLENFISILKAGMEADEQIFHFKIENKRATDMDIHIEPQGSFNRFPVGAVYEVVALGKQDDLGLHIQIQDNDVIVACNGGGAIFDNGTVTLAY